jgi:glycoside hydrolase-like protein
VRLAGRHRGTWAGAALGALVLFGLLAFAPGAAARTLHLQGKTLQAPDSWPVYRLSQHPGMCVRLDRKAVYLGTPSSQQRCPAGAIGRRRAILVEPQGAAARAAAIPSAPRRLASASAGGNLFTGLGFDACSTPSSKSMAAWAQSPYRAIGVYIGGENRACSQPNLTSTWVGEQTAAGWHLIPTYVGMQAPTSACSSCSKLTTIGAVKQGEEAAVDAVADASAVGVGPGSPIYFDMEAYSRTSSASSATLSFLESWTEKLHALGYASGVYSSSSSGIADLGAQVGTGYTLPDNLWIANWNNQQNTLDPNVPSTGWTSHQRIHQYQGGHNESYGGVTINIDTNYVDAATAGGGSSVGAEDPIGELNLTSAPEPGMVRVKGWSFDPNSPTATSEIRVAVGGQAGSSGASEYELGSIATLPRPAIGVQHPEAGANHGFDTRFAASGPQPVCVYALDFAPGEDTLLGCKTTNIPVAVVFSNLRQTRRGVRVWISCAWPEGTVCPGYLALRTRFKIAIPRRGKPPRIQTVTRTLGRRAFHLAGRRGHGFEIGFTRGGRLLLQQRGRLRTQLIASIPGGKRTAVLGLEQPARRR